MNRITLKRQDAVFFNGVLSQSLQGGCSWEERVSVEKFSCFCSGKEKIKGKERKCSLPTGLTDRGGNEGWRDETFHLQKMKAECRGKTGQRPRLKTTAFCHVTL